MVFLDTTVVNVALPAVRADFGAGLTAQQWVVQAYLLLLGALLLTGGALGDRYGHVRVLRIGVVGFGATSLACAAAPSVEALVAATVERASVRGFRTGLDVVAIVVLAGGLIAFFGLRDVRRAQGEGAATRTITRRSAGTRPSDSGAATGPSARASAATRPGGTVRS